MKARNWKKEKIEIVTLGCSKNLVDSEVILTQLNGQGLNAKHESGEQNPDTVIINTCGFIESAKEESIDTILTYSKAKEQGLVSRVFVTGCLSHRYKDELREQIPEIDEWFGTTEVPKLLREFKIDYKKELLGERMVTGTNHYAYLKISEGCDRPCSFCAIPLMRGKHRSFPIEDLVHQAESLAKKGTRELLLIAQDSTYYGLDIYKKRNLAELLRKLSDVNGIDWIRLHYAFPHGFPEDILEVMKERPNICNYIDIPLQHASTNVLKKMRRGSTLDSTRALLERIRTNVPGIGIRTTLMVGHPGEGEREFQELCEFVKEQRFHRLGVFTYSDEEGTYGGENFKDEIPQKVKDERADIVMGIQEEISMERNEALVGKEMRVLVDSFEQECYFGRTEFDSPEVDNEVIISAGDKHLRVGDFVNVVITEAQPFDLMAKVKS